MPLTYACETNQRPGIITAVGVISIVVGSLGILGSGLSGMYGIVFMIMSQVSNTMANVSAQTVTEEDSLDTSQGLADSDRAIVLAQVTKASSLTPERAGHLDSLLAQRGERIFGFAGQPVTPESISSRVTQSGRHDEDERADFFVTGWGTVQVTDEYAVFESEESEPFYAYAEELTQGEHKTLAEAADLVVKEVESQTTINEAQKKGLKEFLSLPTQGLIEDFHDPATDVMSASNVGDGSLLVTFINGHVILDSKGKVTSSAVSNFNTIAGGGMSVSNGSVTLVLLEAVASLGLAIYLLVIGILTLRQSLRARMLHLIYAWLKIPITLLFTLGWTWLIYDLFNSSGGGGKDFAITFLCSFAAVSCVYPLALLYLMNRKSVREYYAT
jgi:hypothetical protein